MLAYIDSMVTIGSVTFEKIAAVYEDMCNVEVNPDRLENGWYIYRITRIITNFPKWPRKEQSRELDLEELCRLFYTKIRSIIDTKWLNHKCTEIGCQK